MVNEVMRNLAAVIPLLYVLCYTTQRSCSFVAGCGVSLRAVVSCEQVVATCERAVGSRQRVLTLAKPWEVARRATAIS